MLSLATYTDKKFVEYSVLITGNAINSHDWYNALAANEYYKCFPSNLNNASTLPCKIYSCFYKNSNARKAKPTKFYLMILTLLINRTCNFIL